MATYLLVWNPIRWEWHEIATAINEIADHGYTNDRWSCGQNRSIQRGDRLFLIRLGKEPRGIIGSGIAETDSFEDLHWDEEKRRQGKLIQCINVRFDRLLNADFGDPIIPRDLLKIDKRFAQMHWDSQSSGVRIPDEIAQELEIFWQENFGNAEIRLPEEISRAEIFFDGSKEAVLVNRYERNSEARKRCLEHYGYLCVICNFDFAKIYGRLGHRFIHVHHLTPLAEINSTYSIDPIQDLRPVCPNCHAMLHRKTPPYSIAELREQLNPDYLAFWNRA